MRSKWEEIATQLHQLEQYARRWEMLPETIEILTTQIKIQERANELYKARYETNNT